MTATNARLDAIAKRVEADRIHFATGNAIQLDDSKDREYLLTLARKQAAALEAGREVLDDLMHEYNHNTDIRYADLQEIRATLGDGDE